jgi:hypothetical protein
VNQLFFFMRALGTGSATGTGALALYSRRMLARDNLVGYTVSFLLVSIAGLADAQLGLNDAGFEKVSNSLIAERTLKAQKWIGCALRGFARWTRTDREPGRLCGLPLLSSF